MRLTVLGQYTKGLKHQNPKAGDEIEAHLTKIKGYLWNGNVREALIWIDSLVDVHGVETGYASIKAFRKNVDDFRTYITNKATTIPNYAEWQRYGERVSTGFVESTVNTMVGKRFAKRQQMRWSKRGAHLLLQIRARTLDGTPRKKFESWYQDLADNQPKPSEQAIAA